MSDDWPDGLGQAACGQVDFLVKQPSQAAAILAPLALAKQARAQGWAPARGVSQALVERVKLELLQIAQVVAQRYEPLA